MKVHKTVTFVTSIDLDQNHFYFALSQQYISIIVGVFQIK